MNYDEFYQSKFIKPENINPNKLPTVQIVKVELSEPNQEGNRQFIVHFNKTDQVLGLNKTNGDMIKTMYGSDTDHWIGQWIGLEARDALSFGEMKLRLFVIRPQDAQMKNRILAETGGQFQPPGDQGGMQSRQAPPQQYQPPPQQAHQQAPQQAPQQQYQPPAGDGGAFYNDDIRAIAGSGSNPASQPDRDALGNPVLPAADDFDDGDIPF